VLSIAPHQSPPFKESRVSIGLGIVGLAHSHVNTYVRQWLDHPEWEVQPRAMWDHDAARLAKAREQFNDLDVTASLEALLSRSDISAVVIASETAHHADHVEQAARAGKAIILQKPIATTLADARRIVEVVGQMRVPFTMAWQMRVDEQHLEMRRMLETGVLGKVSMLRRRHGLPAQTWPGFADSWHVNPALNHSIWADDASHPMDWLLWLWGEPESVMADITRAPDGELDNSQGAAAFRYAHGRLAVIECCFTTLAGCNTTEILGSEGTLIQDYGDLPSCNLPRTDDRAGLRWFTRDAGRWMESDIPSPLNHSSRLAALARPLSEFLQGKRPAIADASEGCSALMMVLASLASAKEGRRVSLRDFREMTDIPRVSSSMKD
jgi:predicted dehydrogenase